MTEAEWLACTDPARILEFLPREGMERKLRLFILACYQRYAHLLDEPTRTAVSLAEQYAERPTGEIEIIAAEQLGERFRWQRSSQAMIADFPPGTKYFIALHLGRCDVVKQLLKQIEGRFREQRNDRLASAIPEIAEVQKLQCNLLREVVGNPFRPVAIDTAWLTRNAGAIPSLAQSIYDERRFTDMPALADALEWAGCTDAAILEHCQNGGEHVRGCWVIDLLLGKE